MFKQICDYIGDIALRHKAVKCYKYQNKTLVNSQGNNRYLEFIIENQPYFQYIKTSNVYTLTLNVQLIGQPKTESDVLRVQNLCFQTINEILAYIKRDDTYKGLLAIYDNDILFTTHLTDDVSSGIRMTLELIVPNPIDLCTFMDNFDFVNEDIEDDLDLNPLPPFGDEEDEELDLTHIKLQKK